MLCLIKSSTRPLVRTISNGPNHALVQMLKQNMQIENANASRNPYKVRAFALAIKVINQLDQPIRTVDDTRNLPGIGPGIARRIEDFLTGPESPYEASQNSEDTLQRRLHRKAKEELMQINGIGKIKAQYLVDNGCMSISDLHQPQFRSMLSRTQQVSLDYFNHLQQQVQRHEAEDVAGAIRQSISSKFEIQLVGSYRRGSPASSDIEVVLFHPCHVHVPTPPSPSSSSSAHKPSPPCTNSKSTKTNKNLLEDDVVRPLTDRGYIAATFFAAAQKWRGIVLVPKRRKTGNDLSPIEARRDRLRQVEEKLGTYRRLDLNLIPLKSRGAAMLALTGDAGFNQHLRNKASKLGLHLNEYGLWRWRVNGVVIDGANGDMNGNGNSNDLGGYWELIKAETEGDILTELGMEYIEPEKRNFLFVLGKSMKSQAKTR